MSDAIDRLTAERDEANARADAAEARVRELREQVQRSGSIVYVVRESDIAAVEVERVRDEEWHANGTLVAWTGESAEDVRGQQDTARRNFIHREAVARAIEAEQAVDPVEAKAIELHRVAYGGRIGFGHATLNAQETFRSLARHVLGQEADDE